MVWGMTLATFTAVHVALSVIGIASGFVGHLLPSHIVGVISLVVLAVAIVALYGLHVRAVWRGIYVISVALALYLDVFAGVVQAFLKVPALHALAPQQAEPPFVIAQLLVLALFILLTVVAVRRFRGEALARA